MLMTIPFAKEVVSAFYFLSRVSALRQRLPAGAMRPSSNAFLPSMAFGTQV
jgi:hypothetical protein